MNACLNCLGLGTQSDAEPHETSRLLYEDPYRSQYGSNGQNLRKVIQQQPDLEALRREREEMDSICHKMSDQVIDVFTVAPLEGTRTSSQDQVKLLLKKNGINPANFSDSKLALFAQQSLATQQRSIHTYLQNQTQGDQGEGSKLHSHSGTANEPSAANAEGVQLSRVATGEELVYKVVRKTGKEPISIELDKRESQAAKAAIG